MTDPGPVTGRARPAKRSRRVLANLASALGGVILTVFLLADPLGIHPIDTWVHHMLTRVHGEPTSPGKEAAEQLWTCGMHPQVLQHEPGQCPICGMNLVPVEPATAGTAAGSPTGERKVLFYRNPMDPTITSPVPRKDEMGMDYVPVYEDEAREAAGVGPTVTIDPAIVQNMNVRTALVERKDLKRRIRTVGYLEYDQQKMVSVTTKYPGFVEKVHVNYVGEPVRRGQALFQIYAPELVQTQQELVSAVSYAHRMESAPDYARDRAMALVDAARQRLSYWDITKEQIERLEKGGKVVRTLTVTAPSAGIVMKRMEGLEGMAVKPGMELFHIADLSSLWLSVEVFEDQLPWLAEDAVATITLSYFPGETFSGRIRFVEPQVSEKTRTVGLRLEVPNRDGRLRAGMYATVVFDPVVATDVVAVPSQAILRSGERNLVVLSEGQGRFLPSQVEIGVEGEDYVQVLSGLEPGAHVVTSAQFLIDSESSLREAIQKLIDAKKAGHTHAQ